MSPVNTAHPRYVTEAGDGMLWRAYHVSASATNPGPSGSTPLVSGASFYWRLNSITDYLYFDVDIHSDWDGVTDPVLEVYVALNAAETANDLIRASVLFDYYTDHDNMESPKTQTIPVDHDIVALAAQGDVHELKFVLDASLAGNVLDAGDIVKMRFWLDDVSTAPVVTAVRFLLGEFRYRTTMPWVFATGAAETSG